MPAQPVATADIPPPVLTEEQLRLMPGMKLNPISPDLRGIARTENFTAPNIAPITPKIGTIPATNTIQPETPLDTVTGGTGQMAWEQAAPLIVKYESSGRNIPNGRYDSTHTANGYFQITDTNWKSYGPRAGVNLSQYPTAMAAPPQVQSAVAKLMYDEQGFGPWAPFNNKLAQAINWQGGAGGAGGTGAGLPYGNEMQSAAQAVQAELFGASSRANKRADDLMGKIGDFEKDLPGSLQRIREARAQADEAITRATEATKYQPKPPLIDGFANLGSLGAIIGMMGGLLTKSPMIASLNAGAAAIEAANKGDMAQYEREFESWKTNSDMLFKIVDLQQKRAQEIMGDEKFMTEEKRTGLDLYLRAIGQQQLADKIRIEGDQFAYEHFKTMGATVEKYDENRIKLQEAHEQHIANQELQAQRLRETSENNRMRNELGRDRLQQSGELGHERNDIARNRLEQSGTLAREHNEIARDRLKQAEQKDPGRSYYYDWRNKYIEEHDGEVPPEELDSKRYKEFQQFYPKASAAASAAGAKEPSVPLSDDAVDMAARRALKGDHSAVVGLGYGTVGANNRTKINNRIAEVAREMGMAPEQVAAVQLEFTGRRAEIQALGRRQAVLDSAVVEAQTLMPQVIQTSENVPRTKFTDINAILLSGERRTGDPNVVRFGIALNSFINVYARAMNPTGVPTVSDKEHARALLSTSWSKGQIQAAMDQLGVEMNAAYRASDVVWRDIVARTASNAPRGPEFIKQTGGGGGGGGGATQTWPTPSPAAIKAVKDDPSLKQDFEGTFGPENTRKYLGQ